MPGVNSLLAALTVKIAGDTVDFEKALARSTKSLASFGKDFDRIGQSIADVGKGLSFAVSGPLAALGGISLKSAGDMQALQLGLNATMKNAELAGKELKLLKESAKLPGLGLQEAVKGSINLQTVGFSAEKARTNIENFGNAVATVGKGREEFERAIYGLQQLANTEFPLGEDLNIIKDAIPQVTPLLKEAFGTARTEELQKLGITSEKVIDVIEKGLGKLPRVTGGINNAFENFSDTMSNSLTTIGLALNKNFNIEGLINKIGDSIAKLASWFEGLSPAIQKTTFVMGGLAIAAGPLLVGLGFLTSSIIPALTTGIKTLSVVFSPLALKIAAVVAVVGALAFVAKSIYDAWQPIAAFFTRIFAQVKLAVSNGLLSVVESVEGVSKHLGIEFGGAKATLKSFADDAKKTLDSTPFVTLAGAAGAVGDAMKNNFNGIIGIFNSVSEAMGGMSEAT